ncbi:MAG: hypothetical protein DMD82_05945 [Candidatus Rokuibacteriota bacterium]|nr:MAG: hypothetical protein DMD82_05945 [Candidatus Rokubacteria bacterium]
MIVGVPREIKIGEQRVALTPAGPVYEQHGVVHYGVTNMPALVPRTSTFALTNATLPYALELARKGVREAVDRNPDLARGVNVWNGRIVHPAVAAAIGVPATPLDEC